MADTRAIVSFGYWPTDGTTLNQKIVSFGYWEPSTTPPGPSTIDRIINMISVLLRGKHKV